MIPGSFRAVGQLPLTANGKLDRATLAQMRGQPLQRSAVTRPLTPVERILQGIWSAFLKVSAVGRDDDFFAIGGDSMLALEVVSACQEAGVTITVLDLIQNSTLSALAAVAENQSARNA